MVTARLWLFAFIFSHHHLLFTQYYPAAFLRIYIFTYTGQCNLIITTGGTGLSIRDVTPEATLSILEKQIPSIPLTICNETTYKYQQPLACLSRGVAGFVNRTLILNVPGSPTAVQQHLDIAIPLLLHALNALTSE